MQWLTPKNGAVIFGVARNAPKQISREACKPRLEPTRLRELSSYFLQFITRPSHANCGPNRRTFTTQYQLFFCVGPAPFCTATCQNAQLPRDLKPVNMPGMTDENQKHIVAIIGGATAGAEVAKQLADRGVDVVVFEKNLRPYGKIEDGLPRWHDSQRRKEYETIGEKLAHDRVHFVPNTKIGTDIDFADLANQWGFSAIVLACGAWADRKLDLSGVEKYKDRTLLYQNSFVYWFNHCNETSYTGKRYELQDGAIVIGGGLASIDMAKIHTLEIARRALAAKGVEISIPDLEHQGIPKALAAAGLSWEGLGVQGCTIFYRRRIEDMPLMSTPDNATPEQIAKAEAGRKRMAEKAMEKFCFRIEPLAAPESILEEDGKMVGLIFRRNKFENGKLSATDQTFEVRAPYVVSSIGSVPDPIPGIPMRGDLFDFSDFDLGRLKEFPTVFGAGNVVTGKGNIVASRKHSTEVSQFIIEKYLGIDDGKPLPKEAQAAASAPARQLAEQIAKSPGVSKTTLDTILDRVRKRQAAVGYTGDFAKWIEKVTPPDFE